jgi:hypothetical protein
MLINQIVKGRNAGYFVILAFRQIGNVRYAQLKEVNPQNFTQVAQGEICLPVDALVEVNQ